ncbi:MAG TPA: sugar nucleotide-binding protein, partial [Deinococcales bacterium]|nr:sugar nucleotide-binding protein [Deinococcales bacterium]
VFDGQRGNYREDDPPNPVNYYSLTKLVAEEAALARGNALVLRTSFKPSRWPHPVAFTDQYTSADFVDVIAPLLAEAIAAFAAGRLEPGLLHVATERKSVFELARRRNPGVRPGSRADANVTIPPDVSLNLERWQAARARWRAEGVEGSRA